MSEPTILDVDDEPSISEVVTIYTAARGLSGHRCA